jgi:hypothetical protein
MDHLQYTLTSALDQHLQALEAWVDEVRREKRTRRPSGIPWRRYESLETVLTRNLTSTSVHPRDRIDLIVFLASQLGIDLARYRRHEDPEFDAPRIAGNILKAARELMAADPEPAKAAS